MSEPINPADPSSYKLLGVDWAIDRASGESPESFSPEHAPIPELPAVIAAIEEETAKAYPERPRTPAAPQIPNAIKAGNTPTDKAAAKTADGAAQVVHINEMMKQIQAPEIELVAINDTWLPAPERVNVVARKEPVTVEEKLAAIQEKTGIDITKKLHHNPNTVRGSTGRKAARMQLKRARKEQMKHLKQTGWMEQQKAEAIERGKPLSPGMRAFLDDDPAVYPIVSATGGSIGISNADAIFPPRVSNGNGA